MELRFEGKVRDFRAALKRLEQARDVGGLATDEVGRRRYQRELRRAEMRSLARQILQGGRWGGDAA